MKLSSAECDVSRIPLLNCCSQITIPILQGFVICTTRYRLFLVMPTEQVQQSLHRKASSRTALWTTVIGTKLRFLLNTKSSIWNPLNCKLSVLFPIDQSFPEGKFGRWKCKLGRIGPSSKRKRLGSVHEWRLLYRGGVKKIKTSIMDWCTYIVMCKWHSIWWEDVKNTKLVDVFYGWSLSCKCKVTSLNTSFCVQKYKLV